jgi:hypothetical protein
MANRTARHKSDRIRFHKVERTFGMRIYHFVMRNTSRGRRCMHRPVRGRTDSNCLRRPGMRLFGVRRSPFRGQNPDTEIEQDKLHDDTCAAY